MKVDVVFAAGDLSEAKVKGKVAIVIDVLRATSVMITALNYGAKDVIPVLSPEEAFSYKRENPKLVLLGGERDTLPIENFDQETHSENKHLNDIVKQDGMFITFDLKQMGVAGDNSCGAKPYVQYTLPAQNYEFHFTMESVF